MRQTTDEVPVRNLILFAFWFAVGYMAVTKVAPIMQAKAEVLDLDEAWELWDDGTGI